MVRAFYGEDIDLRYVTVKKEDASHTLPYVTVDGKIVQEGSVPSLSMLMQYAKEAA